MTAPLQPSRMRTRVYEPRQSAGWGPAVWREIFGELWDARELVYRLFVRDLSSSTRQSVLGFSWIVLAPGVAVATFLLLQRSGVLQVGDTGVPYVLFAFAGLTIWQLFASGLTACTGAIVAGGSMVTKIRFPRAALVFASMGRALVEIAVRLPFVVALLVWYGVELRATLLLFPLLLLPLILLTLGLGLVLSLANAVVRDVAKSLSPLLTLLLFLTPVLYPPPAGSLLAEIARTNPLALLVTGARDLLLTGRLAEPGAYLAAVGAALGVFLVGLRLFHLVESRIAERI